MSSKTIDELKEAKASVEQVITNILNDFYAEFGVGVYSIDLNEFKQICGKRNYMVTLELKM